MICTMSFHIQEFCILPIQCTVVYCVSSEQLINSPKSINSCGMWRCVAGSLVLKLTIASFCTPQNEGTAILWNVRNCLPTDSITSQNNGFHNFTTVKISELEWMIIVTCTDRVLVFVRQEENVWCCSCELWLQRNNKEWQ